MAQDRRGSDAELLTTYRRLVADIHELALVTNRISDREARVVGSTASQWHVLSVISDGPRTVPSIGRRLGLSRQAVQRTCAQLVAAGHVALIPNPQHQKSPLVEATASGLQLQRSLYDASEPTRLTAITEAALELDELSTASRVVRSLLEMMSPRGERAAQTHDPN